MTKKRDTPWLVGKPSNKPKPINPNDEKMDFRVQRDEKSRWRRAAAKRNKTMSKWAKDALNSQAEIDLRK